MLKISSLLKIITFTACILATFGHPPPGDGSGGDRKIVSTILS